LKFARDRRDEIQSPRQRYRIVDRGVLAEALGILLPIT